MTMSHEATAFHPRFPRNPNLRQRSRVLAMLVALWLLALLSCLLLNAVSRVVATAGSVGISGAVGLTVLLAGVRSVGGIRQAVMRAGSRLVGCILLAIVSPVFLGYYVAAVCITRRINSFTCELRIGEQGKPFGWVSFSEELMLYRAFRPNVVYRLPGVINVINGDIGLRRRPPRDADSLLVQPIRLDGLDCRPGVANGPYLRALIRSRSSVPESEAIPKPILRLDDDVWALWHRFARIVYTTAPTDGLIVLRFRPTGATSPQHQPPVVLPLSAPSAELDHFRAQLKLIGFDDSDMITGEVRLAPALIHAAWLAWRHETPEVRGRHGDGAPEARSQRPDKQGVVVPLRSWRRPSFRRSERGG
jgi:hypothetical protein